MCIRDSHKTIADLNKQKNSLLEEYGKGNKVVGQLIDLALLANGLLKMCIRDRYHSVPETTAVTHGIRQCQHEGQRGKKSHE